MCVNLSERLKSILNLCSPKQHHRAKCPIHWDVNRVCKARWQLFGNTPLEYCTVPWPIIILSPRQFCCTFDHFALPVCLPPLAQLGSHLTDGNFVCRIFVYWQVCFVCFDLYLLSFTFFSQSRNCLCPCLFVGVHFLFSLLFLFVNLFHEL